jgi:hypothetical protein
MIVVMCTCYRIRGRALSSLPDPEKSNQIVGEILQLTLFLNAITLPN